MNCECIECVGYRPEPYIEKRNGLYAVFFMGKQCTDFYPTENEAWQAPARVIDA